MNVADAKNKVITLAQSHIGFHEGYNNRNPFATEPEVIKAYGGSMDGLPWCDIFYDYLFCKSFGATIAKQMTFQTSGMSASCKNSYNLYKSNWALYNAPQVGDQVFFYSGGDINHTGIVETVSASQITTIEGNTSDSVARRTYHLNDKTIAGYGRPDWELAVDDEDEESTDGEKTPSETLLDKIKDALTGFRKDTVEEEKKPVAIVQNSNVKFMPGSFPLLTIALRGERRDDVEAFQQLHNLRFDSQLEVDGFYGAKTEEACRFVQKAYGLLEDGECGTDTWTALIRGR